MIIEHEGLTALIYEGGPIDSAKPERRYYAHACGCSVEGCRYNGRVKHAGTPEAARKAAAEAWRTHAKAKHKSLLRAWPAVVARQEATAAAIGGVVAPPRFERMVSEALHAIESARLGQDGAR